jgi:predicted nucleotide-binding protein (sugar kinase/HSP70/actin superfamily)
MKERIKGLIDVDWRKIKALQPDDVKINTNINALKKSLKKHGFFIPFAVWKDGSTIYTIDGHTRKRALEELKHEGEEVPDKLKAFEIDAKDRKEAVQILVEVFNQKHNAFDNEVLINWLEVENVEVKDLNVLNVANFIPETDFPDELTDDYKNKPASMKITFESIEQLQHAENDIQELLDRKYPNAYYSVNSGEL